ncbi:MAG TPA: NAD(P)-binding protein, partial [Mycobacterium sp.]
MATKVSDFGRRVAVFGGGPGGMTAAHELAERGYEVDLYERHQILGGKCRSFGV